MIRQYMYNPTQKQRHEMFYEALRSQNRLEDYYNVLELLSPPPDITTLANPGSFKNINIGIIGGGPAGLAAAFELRKLGFNITIFEALKDRIGGRLYTHYFDKNKKLYGELGAMRVPISHETTWKYIDLFKLNTKQFVQSNENGIIYVRNRHARNDANGLSVMENIYPLFNLTGFERVTPWNKLLSNMVDYYFRQIQPPFRKDIIRVRPEYNQQVISMDFLSIRRALELYGLSQEAIAMISGVNPFTGEFLDNNILEVLQETYTSDFSVVYQIEGGMVNLPLAIFNSLINKYPEDYGDIPIDLLGKIDFRVGHTVEEINQFEKDGPITLTYRHDDNNISSSTFDYVISCAPASAFRNIRSNPPLSVAKEQAVLSATFENSQKTLLLCKERFWERNTMYGPICGGASFTDLPIGSIWYPSYDLDEYGQNCKGNPDRPGVLLASYNYTQDATRIGNLPDDVRIQHIKRQVELVHKLPKGYLDDIVIDYKTVNWNDEYLFLGAFFYMSPEEKRLYTYPLKAPEYNGRLLFAGNYTAGTHAWVQGGLKTGAEAANELVNFILQGRYKRRYR
jgi:monoamine oxidase